MKLEFSKYEGTGNDFIIMNNLEQKFDPLNASLIKKLCSRRFGIGADGLMLLDSSDKHAYSMIYYNADGNLSSMCGNGGRCLAAFARRLNIIEDDAIFEAVDGLHHVRIKSYDIKKHNATVLLQMNDVKEIETGDRFILLDTGSPHYVQFTEDADAIDVITEAKKIRYNARFRERGVNVNFVSLKKNVLHIRTYERGVEDETLSCGTGAVAAAIASAHAGLLNDVEQCSIQTPGGALTVHFKKTGNRFENIFLEGPAAFVFDGALEISKHR